MKELLLEYSVKLYSKIYIPIAQAGEKSGNPTGIDLKELNPLSCEDIPCLVAQIINFLALIALPIAIGMIIVGAYYIVTGGYNPGNLKKGRQIIIWALAGYLLIIVADQIVPLIIDLLN